MLSLKTGGARAAQFATRRLLSESQNNDFDGEEIEGQALYRWLSMTLGENPTKMLGESKYVGSFVFSALFQENKSFYIIKRTFTYPNINPYAQEKTHHIHVTLLDPKKTQNPSPTFMKKRRAFYKDIFTTINFAQYAISYIQSLYPPTQAESINKLNTDLWLTCILLPHKRFLPLQKGMPLGPDHINAGVSFQGISKTLDDISLYQYQKQNQHNQTLPTFTTSSLQRRVLIYREEHVHKVILHELIHAYDIDYNNYDDKCVEKKEKALKQFFEYNLQNDKLLDLNETFTELLACYLHLFLYRFLLQKHNSTNNVPRVSCLIKQEQETYHRTSQTLLSHFECNASKENTKYSTYLPATCNYPLRENTHMYAYLISKAELWDHLNKIPLTVNKSSDFYAFLDYISILSQSPSKDKIPKNVKPLFTMTSLKTEEMISKNKV